MGCIVTMIVLGFLAAAAHAHSAAVLCWLIACAMAFGRKRQ